MLNNIIENPQFLNIKLKQEDSGNNEKEQVGKLPRSYIWMEVGALNHIRSLQRHLCFVYVYFRRNPASATFQQN